MGNITEVFTKAMAVAIQKFQDGGPVMYVLLGLSILGMAFVCDRVIVIVLQQLKLSPKGFLKKASEVFDQSGKSAEEKVDEILEFLKKKNFMIIKKK